MQTKHLCVFIHNWTKDEVGAPWNRFKPSSKRIFSDRFKAFLLLWMVLLLCFKLVCVVLSCLFVIAMWSPAGKGLTFSLSCLLGFVTFTNMSSSTPELRARLPPWNWFKPTSQILSWPFQGGASFVDHLCYIPLVFVMLSCASVYWCLVVTCWQRADLLAFLCDV